MIIAVRLQPLPSKCFVTTISSPAPFIASLILPKGMFAKINEKPRDFIFKLEEKRKCLPSPIMVNENTGPARVASQLGECVFSQPSHNSHTLKYLFPQQPQIILPTTMCAVSCNSNITIVNNKKPMT